MKLTNKQQLVLSIAREKGFVTIQTCSILYKDYKSRKNAILTLEQLGHLKLIKIGKWEYIKG